MAKAKRDTATHRKEDNAPAYFITLDEEGMFTICFELEEDNQCFTSFHPPSMDVRYKRNIVPALSNRKQSRSEKPWDKGTYSITKMKTKAETEAAFSERLKENKLSLVLEGEKLQGRFAIHRDETGWHIYKYKDKYAREEDPLSMELQRSVNRWHISKEEIESQKIGKQKQASKKDKEPTEPEEEITPLLTLDGKKFHFQFYRQLAGERLVCMINEASKAPFVMKEARSNQWKIITPVPDDVAEQEKQLATHARKLLAKAAENQ